jgi:hypothetical protein
MKKQRNAFNNPPPLGVVWDAVVRLYNNEGKLICRAMSVPNVKTALLAKHGKEIATIKCDVWGISIYAEFAAEYGDRYIGDQSVLDNLIAKHVYYPNPQPTQPCTQPEC